MTILMFTVIVKVMKDYKEFRYISHIAVMKEQHTYWFSRWCNCGIFRCM